MPPRSSPAPAAVEAAHELSEWLDLLAYNSADVESTCLAAVQMHWPIDLASEAVRTLGLAELVIHRQCLGPPPAARMVVVTLLQQQQQRWQNPEDVAPRINPVSLQFSSIEAERRFRVQHQQGTFSTCLSLDIIYAIIYFGLLLPCISAWGLDSNPDATASTAYRLSTLGSSAFVLLGMGPLVMVAAQLAWFRVHHTLLRSMLRVMRVAAMHLLQIPVPGCSTQYAATCASASAMAQPHRMATLLAFPGGILAAVATAVLAEAPLFVDRVLGDMVMAPFLIGLPLWGCVDTLIQLALPTVQPLLSATLYCLLGWVLPAAFLRYHELSARKAFLGVLWTQR